MLETSTPSEDGMDMDNQDMDKDIDDLPPVGTPILVGQTEHYGGRLQAVYNDKDMAVGHRQPSCPNPYTPFLDEHEFEFAFRLVKNGISKKAVNDIMSLHTIKSNLPNGHIRSVHTLSKKNSIGSTHMV